MANNDLYLLQFHINEIITPLQSSMMRESPMVFHLSLINSFLCAEQHSTGWIYHNLIICLPTEGYLGYFQFSAIIIKLQGIPVHFSSCVNLPISLGSISKSKAAGSYGKCMFNTLQNSFLKCLLNMFYSYQQCALQEIHHCPHRNGQFLILAI